MSDNWFLTGFGNKKNKRAGQCVRMCTLLFVLLCPVLARSLPADASQAIGGQDPASVSAASAGSADAEGAGTDSSAAGSSTDDGTEDGTVTRESIENKRQQIADSKEEREQMSQDLTDLAAVKQQLESSKADLTEYVTQLDAQVTQMSEKVSSLEDQIADKEKEIAGTQQELDEAQARQREQYQNMKARVKFLYEKGQGSALDYLLQAESFHDLLNKATYLSMLSDYDSRLMKEYEQQTQMVALTKESLEEQKQTLETAQESAAREQAGIQELIADKQAQITGLSTDIASSEQSIADYQAQVNAQDAEIAAMEQSVEDDEKTLKAQEEAAAREAAAKAAAAAEGYTYTGEPFTWPAPVYDSITSDYGYRVHPIYGDTRFHSGLDIAADAGAPIVAAAGGTVVAASYNASMGNYVMISHGDGLFTVYMHCSVLECSQGQSVGAGQEIAKVGSTGASTGPHLHFSVRRNGTYVNPWQYLNGG